MRFILLFLFVLLMACSSISKKEYVCGDRPCVDKKEFNEYFSESLTMEIKTKINKKNKKIDLVKLNTNSLKSKKQKLSMTKKEKKLRLKKEKKKLKADKIKILEERKIKKALKKKQILQEKIASKIPVSNDKIKIENKNLEELNKNIKDTPEKEVVDNSVKSENMKNLCDEIKDCDIDKIADILKAKGKNKPFPNISSN